MRVAVTGSHGLIGSALVERLHDSGHHPIRVVRRGTPRKVASEQARAEATIEWDIDGGVFDPGELQDVDAVVHLAGAGIGDRRWTDAYKKKLVDSRIKGTTLLARAIAEAGDGPTVLVSGSAMGYYGPVEPSRVVDESAPRGEGFLAELCDSWERSTALASAQARVCHIRTGLVLAKHGGALAKMLPLFRFGLGGRFGDGSQMMSWIALDDHVSAMMHLVTDDTIDGPVNLTAPNPVSNKEFTDTLGEVLHRPTLLRVPQFAPRILLGRELADNLLFTGANIVPGRLTDAGFHFAHPTLEAALRAVLDRPDGDASHGDGGDADARSND